jgi:ribosomal protein S18 acetylase RimI-like enzyme
MQDWDPVLRRQVLWVQFEAQRRGYFEQFPEADQHVILRGGAPIGWLIVDRSGPALHGIDMALRAEERNRGTGTSVIRALQAEAAALARPMVITVNNRNERALALYIRLGFRVVRETDVHTVMEWQR